MIGIDLQNRIIDHNSQASRQDRWQDIHIQRKDPASARARTIMQPRMPRGSVTKHEVKAAGTKLSNCADKNKILKQSHRENAARSDQLLDISSLVSSKLYWPTMSIPKFFIPRPTDNSPRFSHQDFSTVTKGDSIGSHPYRQSHICKILYRKSTNSPKMYEVESRSIDLA